MITNPVWFEASIALIELQLTAEDNEWVQMMRKLDKLFTEDITYATR